MSGARHSIKDMESLNSIISAAFQLGAVCPECTKRASEQKASWSDQQSMVYTAWQKLMPEYDNGEWSYICDFYNDTIVVTKSGRYFAYRWVEMDGQIMFGQPYEVAKQFIPVESQSITDEIPGTIKNADETKSAGYSYLDNSLKVIEKTEDELRVANYIMLYDKPDLEGHGSNRANRDGSKGEFFTPETDWKSAYTDSGVIHVDWEHGGDKSTPELSGAHGVLGYVDLKSIKEDEQGIFVERVLNRRNKYVEWLTDLIELGYVGTSSQAISGRVKRADNGMIEQWPLMRDSLTVNPMQWENAGQLPTNVLNNLKALADSSPEFAEVCKSVGLEVAGATTGEPTQTEPESGGNLLREQLEIEGDILNLELQGQGNEIPRVIEIG